MSATGELCLIALVATAAAVADSSAREAVRAGAPHLPSVSVRVERDSQTLRAWVELDFHRHPRLTGVPR
jgi:hypothetical protein